MNLLRRLLCRILGHEDYWIDDAGFKQHYLSCGRCGRWRREWLR